MIKRIAKKRAISKETGKEIVSVGNKWRFSNYKI
jgi:hypothetical protein